MTTKMVFEYRPLLGFVSVLEIVLFLLSSWALPGNWYHAHGFSCW